MLASMGFNLSGQTGSGHSENPKMPRLFFIIFLLFLAVGGFLVLKLGKDRVGIYLQARGVTRDEVISDEADDSDLEFLQRRGVGTDSTSLIHFLEQHSPIDVDPQDLEPWVYQLGSDSLEKREQASKKLAQTGLAALEALRKAKENPNKEIARRAHELVEKQENDTCWALPLAAVRVLVKQQHPETLQVLMRLLPFAIWDQLIQEIWWDIDRLVSTQGSLPAPIRSALMDRCEARRALAACFAARLGSEEEKATVRKLLEDKSPLVRLRAAQGLLAQSDKICIPTLVELLGCSSVDICWQAEELLHWLARGDCPPDTIGGGTPQNRQWVLNAWRKWWMDKQDSLDLLELRSANVQPCLFLVMQCENKGRIHVNKMRLLGSDGRVRWSYESYDDLVDFQLLHQNNFLITSRNGGLTILTADGRVVQTIPVRSPAGCCQLPNGNFLILSNTIRQISSSGRDIYRCIPEKSYDSVIDAGKGYLEAVDLDSMRDEGFARIVQLAPSSGKETTEVRIRPLFLAGQLDVQKQATGHYLLWHRNSDDVLETSPTGQRFGRWPVREVSFAVKLRNGHLLVSHRGNRWNRLVEIAPKDTELWEAFTESAPIESIQPCFELIGLGFQVRRKAFSGLNTMEYRTTALESHDPRVRCWSAVALRELGPRGLPAFDHLVRALSDDDESVRDAASQAIVAMGKEALPRIIGLLKSENERARWAGVGLLFCDSLRSPEIMPKVLKCLSDPSPNVRGHVIYCLGNICIGEKRAHPGLIRALDDRDPSLREHAIFYLGHASLDSDRVVPHLRKAIGDPDTRVRAAAASALGDLGPGAVDATLDLIRALKKDQNEVRRCAAIALGRIEQRNDLILHALLDCLQNDSSLSVRAGAARGLGEIGPRAAIGVPFLVGILRSPLKEPSALESLRLDCIWALGRIHQNPDLSLAVLEAVLTDDNADGRERMAAVESIGSFGPRANEVVPLLKKLQSLKPGAGASNLEIQKAIDNITRAPENAK
jgi:HEAT repeat protein